LTSPIYLHELTDGFKAERVIGEWIDFYNTERPHSSFDGRTPAEAYGIGQAQQRQQDVIKRIQAA
jgi:putative transposase